MGLTDINSVRRAEEEEGGADGAERDQLQFSNGSSVSEIRRFEIAFDRPEALYFSGDCVTGEVQISLEDTIHVKGVVVRFVGEAYVNVPWEEEAPEGGAAVRGAAATWQKRCRNLRTLASRGRKNKVKPSGSGMGNHGFAPVGDMKEDGPTPAPHANGGHTVKSESADHAVPEKEGCETPAARTASEQQHKSLATVKEEREEDEERIVEEEIRLVGGGGARGGGGVGAGHQGGAGGAPARADDESSGKVKKKKSSAGAATSRRPHPPPDQGVNKRRMAAKIRSHEKYFDYKYYVFGHKYSSAREHLSSGAHRFRFSYVLPGKLPSSFHGRYGYVRYFCEASLERAWAASITRKAMFSVSASVDVNREPRADSGAGGHRSTHGCLFCCPRGTVMAEAGVRRRGFVPGERIPLRAHILNVSDQCVRRTRARLLQVVTYHSSNGPRSKVDEVVVTEAERGQVARGEADSWGEDVATHHVTATGPTHQQHTPPPVSLEIPPLPANFKCSEFCKIIDVDYRLDFVVEVEGELEPLHIRMPIVVGTVPLERVFRSMELEPRRRSTASDRAEGSSALAVPGSSQYIEFPLPRFEPCTWGPRHVEAYFHHEVARKLNDDEESSSAPMATSEGPGGGAAAKAAKSVTSVATAGALPGVGSTLRVHRKGETFAPRYVCYRLKEAAAAAEGGEGGEANHEDNARAAGGRSSMGELLSLSPLNPSHLRGMTSPSEAWIPRDTSETELVSPAGEPSGKGKRS